MHYSYILLSRSFFIKIYFLSYLLTNFDVRVVNLYFTDCSFAIRFLIFYIFIHKGISIP